MPFSFRARPFCCTPSSWNQLLPRHLSTSQVAQNRDIMTNNEFVITPETCFSFCNPTIIFQTGNPIVSFDYSVFLSLMTLLHKSSFWFLLPVSSATALIITLLADCTSLLTSLPASSFILWI